MARHVEGPWFRSGKDTWYATIGGKSVSLGVKGVANRAEAVAEWHRVMAAALAPAPTPAPVPITVPTPAPEPVQVKSTTVGEILSAYLATKKGVILDATLDTYTSLSRHLIEKFGTTPAATLKKETVTLWIASLKLGVNTRTDIAALLCSSYKWAEEEGVLNSNPLKGLKRPARQSRGAKSMVSKENHEKFMKVLNRPTHLLVTLLYETGARPSELTRLEAHQIDFDNGVAILAEHKTAKTTGRVRMIALTPKAVDLLRKEAKRHPKGPLLRNNRGTPWHRHAIVLAMAAASRKSGVKVTSYKYRHTFATDALARGVPDAAVAALMGHSGTAMLHKHYSHLTSQGRVLRESVGKVRAQEEQPAERTIGPRDLTVSAPQLSWATSDPIHSAATTHIQSTVAYPLTGYSIDW